MGEVHANCPRGWAVNDGSSTKVNLPAAALERLGSVLEMGRMVMVEHPRLPAWAGMIDTPWTATLPAQMTLYDMQYLLHIRSLDNVVTLKGTTAQIVEQMVAAANLQEDLFLRMGNVDSGPERTEKFDQRTVWEQMVDLVKRAGLEMQFRPARDAANKLVIWIDIKKRLGVYTGFLLHDGKSKNLEVTGATVDGEIWNRVIGLSSTGATGAALQTAARIEAESVKRYRLRSQVVQFPNVKDINLLTSNAKVALAASAYPHLNLKVNILDQGDTFQHLGLGNEYMVHAAQVYLPGGVRGWRGLGRLTAMAYDEENNKMAASLIGDL
jgi:hypothetical protein